jgi:hypothetical protein
MIGGIEETSASFEARTAPRSYPTVAAQRVRRDMSATGQSRRRNSTDLLGNLRKLALGVVRGDEPDCPGERNLITALKGLQRAADRRGNRGTRFRALVLQGAACGAERHRGLEGLFDPASTGNVEIEVARLEHN